MAELIFPSPNWRITSNDHCKDLWAMYFDQNLKKNFLVVKQGLPSVTVTFSCDEFCRLLSDNIKTPSFYDEHLKKDVKIAGSDSVILLLNIKNKNWDLSNVLQFLDGKGLCKYFTFMGLMQNFKKPQRIVPACDLLDCDFGEKEQGWTQNYFKTQIQSNNKDINLGNGLESSGKTFTISDKISNKLYFQSKTGKGSLLNMSGTHLLAIINFENEKCVLFSFQNGKLIFTFYRESIGYGCKSIVYLTQKLVSIKEYYYNGFTCLVWSNGINLYLSKIEFNFDKPHFVKLMHFQIKDQIKGVKCILKCNQYLLLVTLNRSYYVSEINKLEVTEDIESSSNKFLLELQKCATRISQLERNLNSMTEFLKNKEMIKEGGFDLGSKGSQIFLKSRVKGKLDKTYWKVRFLIKIRNKQHVEVKGFESDLSYGATLKIESDLVMRGKVKVSLIGNFGCEFQVLVVNLGCIGEELQAMKNKSISKNLYQVAKNRKTCLKA